MKHTIGASIALASTLLLVSCAGGSGSTGPIDPKPLDTYMSKVVVSDTQENLDVMVSGPMLNMVTRDKLSAFAATYLQRGKGAMTISLPVGGENAEIADQTAVAVRAHLKRAGVPDLALDAVTVDATGQTNPSIKLSFASTSATGPACTVEHDLRKSYYNVTSPNFGCATAANLAAMIANPNDLREASPNALGSGDTAARAAQSYRDGTTEAAPSASASGDPATSATN